jgi:hypothetical protein
MGRRARSVPMLQAQIVARAMFEGSEAAPAAAAPRDALADRRMANSTLPSIIVRPICPGSFATIPAQPCSRSRSAATLWDRST